MQRRRKGNIKGKEKKGLGKERNGNGKEWERKAINGNEERDGKVKKRNRKRPGKENK